MNQEKHTATIQYNHTLPELEEQVKSYVDDYVENGHFEENPEDMTHEIADTVTPVYNADLIGLWLDYGADFERYGRNVGIPYENDDTMEQVIQTDLFYYLEQQARNYLHDEHKDYVNEAR